MLEYGWNVVGFFRVWFMVNIFSEWHDVLSECDGLPLNGDGMVLQLTDTAEVKQVLMALVLYNSRIRAGNVGWHLEYEADGHDLYIYRVSH